MRDLYETVIGLEVHVELNTKTKIFCGCSTEFGGAPNTHTCPVCTGMPGSLPVLNKSVVEKAMAVGLATECEITRRSLFDRKNYFYPDNPQNYQISQLYYPICRNGRVRIEVNDTNNQISMNASNQPDTNNGGDVSRNYKNIRIHEIHMEEDAGKLIHDEKTDSTLVDYNRSGVPLIEIVSEPDMRSAEEVIAYLEKLRIIIQYLGASDCKLNEGSMRADVNLSVRKKNMYAGTTTEEVEKELTGIATEKVETKLPGTTTEEAEKELPLGTRTEMKNLNSFRAIARAIENERERQIALLESGEEVIMETRRWDDNEGRSYPMRSKEDAKDYRYFPDPDLAPIVINDEWINEIRNRQPEFRDEKIERYKKEYGIPDYDIDIITGTKHLADLFEETIKLGANPKKVSNWLMGETMRLAKEHEMDIDNISFSAKNLAKIIALVDVGTINGNVAKEVFEKVFTDDIDPKKYVEENGLKMVNDDEALRATIQEVIAANPKSVEDYLNGKEKAMGFLVGQTMKAMKGKANPGAVNKILKEILG